MKMKITDALLCLLLIVVYSASSALANSVHGCGGFVEVELRTVDGLVKEITHCAPNGYYFIPVYDKGSFVIKISGPEGWSWDQDKVPVVIDDTGCNNNEDINFRFFMVELGFQNGLVVDIFFFPGYEIRGSVVAQGNPILGIHIYLYSDDVVQVDCPQDSGNAPGRRKALCDAVSGADGMVIFKSIPCGPYKLIPYYKGENSVFDVSPSVLSVSVEHQHLTVPQKFEVCYFFWLTLSTIPRDPRKNGAKRILFYPRLHHILVTNNGCQAPVALFSGSPGLYLEGSVSPPISYVHVTIIAAEDNSITPVRKGEVALETAIQADGSFVAGPLYDDITYNIKASKPGFHIKQVGPSSFYCQKLSQMVYVKIHSKDDAIEPIPSLLMSLSGDDGYKNNSISWSGGINLCF